MIVVDTGALYALVDAAEPDHAAIVAFLRGSSEALVTTPLVLAELDHLVGSRLGESARGRVMARLARGALNLSQFDAEAFALAAATADSYADMRLGLTDAAVMVAADRAGTTTILTLDHRHFRALRPLDTRHAAFRLLPADAD